MSYPTPQIIIGKPSTGQQGDSSAQAYNKYNIHTHSQAQSSNPLLLNIKPGFFLSGIDNFGNQLFPENTIVLMVNSEEITLNNYPLSFTLKANLTFIDNTNNQNLINVNNVKVEVNNSYIVLPVSVGGFINASQTDYLSLDNFSGFITLNSPLTYKLFPIVIKNVNKAYLHKLDIKLITLSNVTAAINIGVLINNDHYDYFDVSDTFPTTIKLDLNTLNQSSLVNKDDSVSIFVRSIVTANTSLILAYNLYLQKV